MYISGRKQLFSLPLLAQSLPQNNLKWPDPYCTGMVQLLVTKYIDKSELSSVWPLMDFTFPPLRNNLHIAFHHLVLCSAHVTSSLLCPFCSWTIGKCYCLFLWGLQEHFYLLTCFFCLSRDCTFNYASCRQTRISFYFVRFDSLPENVWSEAFVLIWALLSALKRNIPIFFFPCSKLPQLCCSFI